jgi:hypothetical protein
MPLEDHDKDFERDEMTPSALPYASLGDFSLQRPYSRTMQGGNFDNSGRKSFVQMSFEGEYYACN